jgi:hypothetical protein
MRNFLIAGVALAALTGFIAPASAGLLSTSTMSLTINGTIYNPISSIDGVNNGNPTAETANLNTALNTTGFVYLDTSDSTASTTGIGGGITFTVTAPTNTSDGTWTVAWTDTNTALLPNLPLTLDLEVGLFGGNGKNANGAGFLFSNVLLPVSPNSGSGSFDIDFINHGDEQPDLSHMTLTGGNAHGATTPVPEPLTLSLLGTGLVGLGMIKRHRRTA